MSPCRARLHSAILRHLYLVVNPTVSHNMWTTLGFDKCEAGCRDGIWSRSVNCREPARMGTRETEAVS